MRFLNVLRPYDFPIKVNYSLTVILKKGNEGDPLFEYSYSNKNNDVEMATAFKISTETGTLKFEEMFNQSRELHSLTCKNLRNFVTFANVRFYVTRLSPM